MGTHTATHMCIHNTQMCKMQKNQRLGHRFGKSPSCLSFHACLSLRPVADFLVRLSLNDQPTNNDAETLNHESLACSLDLFLTSSFNLNSSIYLNLHPVVIYIPLCDPLPISTFCPCCFLRVWQLHLFSSQSPLCPCKSCLTSFYLFMTLITAIYFHTAYKYPRTEDTPLPTFVPLGAPFLQQ